jgi:protein-export membrane protein SecD
MADPDQNQNIEEPKGVYRGRTFHPLAIPLLSIVSAHAIYLYVWLYRRYAEIRRADPEATSVSPARAVGFSLIPVFNIFWLPYVYFDLARALQRLQQKRVGRCLFWPYSIPILMIGVPFLASLIIALMQSSLHMRLMYLWPIVILCQWCGMIIAQSSLNRAWSVGATPDLTAAGPEPHPLCQHYRRQLFGSLACLVPILLAVSLVIREAIHVHDFLPAKGTRFGMTLVPLRDAAISEADLQVAIKSLQQRLNTLSEDSPAIVRRSDAPGEHIEVEVPDSYDNEQVRDLLQLGGVLELKEVLGDAHASEAEALASTGNKIPEGWETLKERGESGNCYICRRQPLFTGDDIQFARQGQDPYSDRPVVSVRLTEPAGERMGAYSLNNIGNHLAIVLDGSVISAPTIMSRIDRDVQITGQFTPAEVRGLSVVLRAGSGVLPHPGRVTSERTVPKFHWVVRQSVRAGIFALALVAMIVVFFRVVPGCRHTL